MITALLKAVRTENILKVLVEDRPTTSYFQQKQTIRHLGWYTLGISPRQLMVVIHGGLKQALRKYMAFYKTPYNLLIAPVTRTPVQPPFP